ncbi:MAG TPA: hypothetical protein ENG69_01400 [Candidatus Korarchaeota archaeon]|nr:hypothetical protein [Candidatus Korarchaeota archaeon]
MRVSEEIPEELICAYEDFILTFTDESGERKYFEKIPELIEERKRSLRVDYDDLFSYLPTREHAKELLVNPRMHIEAASQALSRIIKRYGDISTEELELYARGRFHVRFFNLPTTAAIRDLPSYSLGRFVQISGIVIRVSDVFDKPLKIAYICTNCGAVVFADPNEPKPKDCPGCENPNFRRDLDRTELVSWQLIRIQERPEDLPPGAMPKHVDAILLDDLVDEVKPGDRVTLTAVISLRPAKRREDAGYGILFKRYLEVNDVEVPSRVYEKIEITPEDERKILELSQDPKLEEKIIDSIAPSIYGHRIKKKAIALALFGGNPVTLPDGTRVRGEINLLFVGDPGTAKCISGDTLVFTSDGLVRADRLIKEGETAETPDGFISPLESRVLSMTSSLSLEWAAPTVAAKRTQNSDLLEIKTKSGLRIRVTRTHPFLTIGRDGYVRFLPASELKRGMFVAVIGNFQPSEVQPPVTSTLTPDENTAELIGMVLPRARFSEERGRLFLRLMLPASLADRFKELAEPLGPVKLEAHSAALHATVRLKRNVASDLFSLLPTLRHHPQAREIPQWLISADLPVLRGFLRGYCSVEGSYLQKSKRAAILARNARILHQIRLILTRLGVTHPKITRSKSGFRLLISPAQADILRKSLAEGGPVPEPLVKAAAQKKADDQADRIPYVGALLSKLRKNLGVPRSKIGIPTPTLIRYEKGLSHIPRNRLRVALEELEKAARDLGPFPANREIRRELAYLRMLAESDIAWDEIASIRVVHGDGWVYDIEVPNNRNFVANGFVIHNSQLLKYTAQIAPRGLYTTGKGATAAGLTAAVVRDATTGGWTLEAGALVLADRGVACIDEFDKMNENDRRAIHEAMEQQTISIAKAGIVATLNARTTIIAAANPKYGRYDPLRSPAENINLPATILSRFDLIFLIRDEPQEDLDAGVAGHILRARMGTNPSVEPAIPPDLLKKYIAYAKQRVRPQMTEEASRVIKEFYLEMRRQVGKLSAETEGPLPIPLTARQLEALIRLAEARARMFLRSYVTEEDARVAVELMREMLSEVGLDVVAGVYDISGVMVGPFMSAVKRREELLKLLNEMAAKAESRMVSEEEFIRSAVEVLQIEKPVIKREIRVLKENGLIYSPRPGFLKPAARP